MKEVRGKGLFIGIEFTAKKKDAWEFSLKMLKNGLIAKPTHDNIIRFAPPLIATDTNINDMLDIVKKSWHEHSD